MQTKIIFPTLILLTLFLAFSFKPEKKVLGAGDTVTDKGTYFENVTVESTVKIEKATNEVRVEKWNGEESLTFKPVGTYETSSYDFTDKDVKAVSADGKSTVVITPTANSISVDTILHEKPATDTIWYDIVGYENFNFFYQPPFNTAEEQLNDPSIVSCTETDCVNGNGEVVAHRPENAVGSYAIYHKTKKDNCSNCGTPNYKTGKFGHLFRPKLIDSLGVESWGTFVLQNGQIGVKIPTNIYNNKKTDWSNFLVDPTYGDTTYGVSNGTRAANAIVGNEMGNAPANGTVTSLSLSLDGNGVGSVNIKGVLYDYVVDASTIVTNGVTPAGTLDATAGGVYKTITYSSSPSIVSGSPYAIGGISDSTIRYFYDNTATQGWFDDTNSYATPQDTAIQTNTTRDTSYYLTYTTGGGGGGGTVKVPDLIWIE
jgi:hypothetical protein